MKKFLYLLLCVLFITSFFAGCGKPEEKNSKINIVTTIFPEYDWVKEIVGDKADNVNLTLLLDNGVDLHSYQPTADDIIKISSSDMFIYVGGESDKWVADALKEAKNKNMTVINLLEVLGDSVKQEEVVEGMQGEAEEDSSEPEYDEHVWLSLKNAELFCKKISEKLCEIDKTNADTYKSNETAYLEKLNSLDSQYKSAADTSATKTLLFADRFPFRYMTDDYGLKYYAAFVGCSAETEASFETVTFLAKKIDELKLSSVLTLEGSRHKIADTVISNTAAKNQKIIKLNSMQSTTMNNIKNKTTYLSVMKKNLEALKTALA